MVLLSSSQHTFLHKNTVLGRKSGYGADSLADSCGISLTTVLQAEKHGDSQIQSVAEKYHDGVSDSFVKAAKPVASFL